VVDEAIRAGATVRQLIGVSHADQVGGDAAASWLQVRQHVAPEVRRGGIAVQQHDGVALSHLHVRRLAAVAAHVSHRDNKKKSNHSYTLPALPGGIRFALTTCLRAHHRPRAAPPGM